MEFLSQHPSFSDESETKGFDIVAGKKWIYPENFPHRDYQFEIVKTALYHNTLVGLPTGLGKTFIAAVVMYNFWRWYPMGIIVFLAPTKPLVAQQIDACYEIMGIPISETIELTGTTNQKQRQQAWTKKRVIFATPQTFQKDIEKNIVPLDLIKCVVIDEAHKALGKYAYGEIVRMLYEVNKYFRILALSATPGSKLEAVQEVIKNLHITHLELRDDTSPDILPYVNEKKFDIVQVSLGNDLTHFHERYLAIVDPYYRILIQHKVLNCPLTNMSKGRLFLARQEFQKRAKNSYVNTTVQKNFGIVYTMVYAKELMVNHGLRAFCQFYNTHSDKFWIKDVPDLEILLKEIEEYLGPFPDVNALITGNIKKVPDDLKFGHGKFLKLKDVLETHFQNASENKVDTRAIVFVEYRDSVNEIYVLLLKFQPLIRPQVFIGQAKAGLKQKDQKLALKNFRENKVNVLISTSVGEEGLDVGEVDLIVCFDNAAHSTTRLIQRIGRTGRKRNGRVIALATEGKENHQLKSVLSRKETFNTKILRSSGVITALNNKSPRMVPQGINPECLKMYITVLPVTPRGRAMRKIKGSKISKAAKKNTKTSTNNSSNITNWLQNTKNNTAIQTNNTKKNNQPSMMSFLQSIPPLQNMSQDNEIISMRVEEIYKPQSNLLQSRKVDIPKIKLSDVKLLSSNKEAIEFLTLCAMKESMKDLVNNNSIADIPYMPMHFDDDVDPFINYDVPPYKILECLESLDVYVPIIYDNENDYVYENNVDDLNNWEPIEFLDNDHDFERLRSSNFSQLPKGQFENLLDDSSDSNQTLYCPDNTLPSNERIELTGDGDNSILPKKEAGILNKQNETSDLSHSVVENGAFEDLLNTSSDDSIQILNDDSNDGKVDFSSDELTIQNYTPEAKETPKKLQALTSPFDVDFNKDFGSWENAQTNFLLSSTLRCSSPNLITSRRSLMSSFQQTNSEIEKKTQNSSNQLNTNDNKSPDLCRLLNNQKPGQSNVNVTISNSNEKSTICSEKFNEKIEACSSDDDLFGVESLLADSDTDEQSTAIDQFNINHEKSTDTKISSVVKKNIHETDIDKKTVVDNIKNDELSTKVVEEVQNENNDDRLPSNSNKQNDSNETFVDDCDWSSDFELAVEPITESKYFGTNFNSASCDKSNVCQTATTSKHSKALVMSQKENDLNWISVSKPKSQENYVNKNKLKNNNRKYSSSNSLRPAQRDSNSDDDFLPTKIERRDAKGLKSNERPSDSLKPVKTRLTLQKNDSSKSRSTTSLTDRFAAPKKFASGCTNTSGMNSLWVQRKRSISFNNSKKRKKVKKRDNDRKRRKNEFIIDEADVSDDYSSGSSGDNDDDEDNDNDLEDFVSYTQYHDQTVDMRAHYLQSIKSPNIKPGKFLIKQPRNIRPEVEIYSQVIPEENNSYIHDSFCVGDEEILEIISSDEITVFDETQRHLEEKKRKRKNVVSDGSRSKRKRIIQDNESSEDEIEKMRAQIAEESMILKKL